MPLGLMQFASAPRRGLVAEEWHDTQPTATALRGLAGKQGCEEINSAWLTGARPDTSL